MTFLVLALVNIFLGEVLAVRFSPRQVAPYWNWSLDRFRMGSSWPKPEDQVNWKCWKAMLNSIYFSKSGEVMWSIHMTIWYYMTILCCDISDRTMDKYAMKTIQQSPQVTQTWLQPGDISATCLSPSSCCQVLDSCIAPGRRTSMHDMIYVHIDIYICI